MLTLFVILSVIIAVFTLFYVIYSYLVGYRLLEILVQDWNLFGTTLLSKKVSGRWVFKLFTSRKELKNGYINISIDGKYFREGEQIGELVGVRACKDTGEICQVLYTIRRDFFPPVKELMEKLGFTQEEDDYWVKDDISVLFKWNRSSITVLTTNESLRKIPRNARREKIERITKELYSI